MQYFLGVFNSTSQSSWIVWLAVAGIFGVVGFILAQKLWGKRSKRLRRALDDSSYLASQWATLGISQSQLVEKLTVRVEDEMDRSQRESAELVTDLRQKEVAVERLEAQVRELEATRSTMTSLEVESLQLQADEVTKRDSRIDTLESRLKYVSSQNEQMADDHQVQVRLLLDRIQTLEASDAAKANAELVSSNDELTRNFEAKSIELEALRDEFYSKEKALSILRDQNASLKKSVDEIVAGWNKKKSGQSDLIELQAKLTKREREHSELLTAFERRGVELEMLKNADETRDGGELFAMKRELDDNQDKVKRSISQIDTLLEVIADRDAKLALLEKQLDGSPVVREGQIQALTQTVADLQLELNKFRDGAGLSRAHHEQSQDIQLVDRNPARKPKRRSMGPEILRGKSTIYFEKGSSQFDTKFEVAIAEIARDVLASGCQLSLLGFSDNSSTENENMPLSTQRAKAVSKEFEKNGVGASLVMVRGKGEDHSFSQPDELWRARRVEIVVLPVAEIVN